MINAQHKMYVALKNLSNWLYKFALNNINKMAHQLLTIIIILYEIHMQEQHILLIT